MSADSVPADPPDERSVVAWADVRTGAIAGLALLALATIAIAVADNQMDDFDGSALERMLLLPLFVAYAVAGAVGSRDGRSAPLTNGALAAIGALVLWIPLRVVMWVVRDTDRSLVGGDDPVFSIGAIFGQLVIASVFGMLGALARQRWAHHRSSVGSSLPPAGDDAA